MTQCVKKIAGFIADVGNVFIKRLLILTFFYFCLNVYYIYIYAFKDPPPSMAVMSLTVHPSSPRFYDVVLRHPVYGHLGWFLGRRVFRLVKVDVNRNKISSDDNTQ